MMLAGFIIIDAMVVAVRINLIIGICIRDHGLCMPAVISVTLTAHVAHCISMVWLAPVIFV